MEEKTIFEVIHSMDTVTNRLIIQWNKSFNADLGISHILVLAHLREYGRSRPSDIARALGLTPATLTHLSNKLVKKQLAVRAADESDRRILYLDITEEGREVTAKANIAGQKLRRELFEKLTDEEVEQLLHIFGKWNQD